MGGHRKLPMRDLVRLLEGLGLANVRTYIQSCNVVFQSERTDLPELAQEIGAAIGDSHGFTPQIMFLSQAALATAVSRNPYPEAAREPKSLHFYFLETRPPDPDLAQLTTLKTESERFELIDTVFYLHAPDGIGRSKLAARVEKALGVATTARNWRTVSKVMKMVKAVSSDKEAL